MTMGEYIKQLRLEKGWSQDELGKRVGVNRAAVNKWEVGTVENIKRSTIKALADTLGVSPCDLMQWDEETHLEQIQKEVNACEIIEESYGKEALEILTMFLELDSIDRIAVKGMLSALIQQDKYSIQKESKNA